MNEIDFRLVLFYISIYTLSFDRLTWPVLTPSWGGVDPTYLVDIRFKTPQRDCEHRHHQ